MSEGILSLVEEIERLAAYDGPWRTLRGEAAALRRAAAELRERMDRLDDVLIVALVGGSGVGKSTLLNAIAGDQIAETSEMRPCTAVPMVYHPPGARFHFDAPDAAGESWKSVPRSALEHLILIDTPDSDTIVREHREAVIRTLEKCDLIIM
ncbi:MAG TPA: ATP-binding cassette domain-containing protein, partial [Candidatus Hydrogenedentes bacterium]|nr:ATP-binding cassette domain-containing protein [Candidatus Hydrogenedentota bacterium]